MFNLLGPNFAVDVVVDLFAGTGALGLEALSRGASQCIFVDKERSSIRVIRQNIALCKGAETHSRVLHADWREALNRLVESGQTRIGGLFLDPPYAKSYWLPVLEHIQRIGLTVDGAIVCEHPDDENLPEEIALYRLQKRRTYGDIAVSIYHMQRRDESR
jgi:16S rRNA (guanine966-N2)-methyltransferase